MDKYINFSLQLEKLKCFFQLHDYLTIIPRARMGYESIAHEAEWAIDSKAMRARGIMVLVKSN